MASHCIGFTRYHQLGEVLECPCQSSARQFGVRVRSPSLSPCWAPASHCQLTPDHGTTMLMMRSGTDKVRPAEVLTAVTHDADVLSTSSHSSPWITTADLPYRRSTELV